MNQINQNNNINTNPFVLQPNLFINRPIMNINPMIQNNFNSLSISNSDNIKKINVGFYHVKGSTFIICELNKKIYDLIREYRIKANDFGENTFVFNGQKIDPLSSSKISEVGISDLNTITVSPKGI